MRLMQRIRDSIKSDTFPAFVRSFVLNYYANNKNSKETEKYNAGTGVPDWVVNALNEVNIEI